MLNDFIATRLSPYVVKLDWTVSDAANASWVYVNGVCQLSGLVSSDTARSQEVNLDEGESAFVEVHEVAAGVPVAPIGVSANSSPAVSWPSVSGADTYRVYVNSDLVTALSSTGDKYYKLILPLTLETGWSKVEVTALTGTEESAVISAWYKVYGLTQAPRAVALSGTGNVFTLTFSR